MYVVDANTDDPIPVAFLSRLAGGETGATSHIRAGRTQGCERRSWRRASLFVTDGSGDLQYFVSAPTRPVLRAFRLRTSARRRRGVGLRYPITDPSTAHDHTSICRPSHRVGKLRKGLSELPLASYECCRDSVQGIDGRYSSQHGKLLKCRRS
jgi:hypothetical protein